MRLMGVINYHTTTASHATSVQRPAAIASVRVQALPARKNNRKVVGNSCVLSLSFGTFGVNKTDL